MPNFINIGSTHGFLGMYTHMRAEFVKTYFLGSAEPKTNISMNRFFHDHNTFFCIEYKVKYSNRGSLFQFKLKPNKLVFVHELRSKLNIILVLDKDYSRKIQPHDIFDPK